MSTVNSRRFGRLPENEIVSQLAVSAGQQLWVGGTDTTAEGTWLWQQDGADSDQFWQGDSSGFNVNDSYTDWLTGNPDNAGGDQDYLLLEPTGQWNDEDNLEAGTGYIVEWDADEVLDASEPLTYSIVSQTVAGAFAINTDSGEITVADGSLLDYESAASHSITVRVTDVDSLTYDELFTIALNDINDAPVITSNGGGATADINVAENSTAVTTVAATDDEVPGQTLAYSISGGADAAKFAINSSSGVLTFVAAPDRESPTDFDSNNVYEVTVQASDGVGGTDSQDISVTITPVNENSPLITSDGGGASANLNVNENSTSVTTVTRNGQRSASRDTYLLDQRRPRRGRICNQQFERCVVVHLGAGL